MATLFAESYDPYLAVADGTNSGMWTTLGGSLSTTTQFAQGQSHSVGASAANFPSSEGTIYGSIRLIVGGTASPTNYYSLTFIDSGTAQCTIRWNTDGSIGLYLGAATGTLIQTFPGVYVRNVWASFQFKVVIGTGTTGSIELRMNGSLTNVVTSTGINTRISVNSTANGFSYTTASGSPLVDDLYFNNTNGNNPVSWVGDLRAIQQTPALATQSQFSKQPIIDTQTVVPGFSSTLFNPNVVVYIQFRPTKTELINSVTFSVSVAVNANMKVAIYDGNGFGGAPGNVLGISNPVVNPVVGTQVATFSSPPAVMVGSTYYIAYNQDVAISYGYNYGSYVQYTGNTGFSVFPVNGPTGLSGPIAGQIVQTSVVNYTRDNSASLQELIGDGDTSYNYALTPSQDKYSMSQIPTTYSVVAMQYYVMWRRSDVGPRTAQLSVAANGSADTALIANAALPTSYQFQFTTRELDPTGAAWTPTSVNSAILGVAVTA